WAVLDESRWQPYFIHYMVILACFVSVPTDVSRRSFTENVNWSLLPARLTLVFTYLYSGLQKLNYQFATDVFPWMVGPLKWQIHLDLSRCGPGGEGAIALCAAAFEAVAGLLLLFPRTRRPAALFLIGM